MVVSGFLVEVAKVSDEEMAGWRRDYPEAFDRDYDARDGRVPVRLASGIRRRDGQEHSS